MTRSPARTSPVGRGTGFSRCGVFPPTAENSLAGPIRCPVPWFNHDGFKDSFRSPRAPYATSFTLSSAFARRPCPEIGNGAPYVLSTCLRFGRGLAPSRATDECGKPLIDPEPRLPGRSQESGGAYHLVRQQGRAVAEILQS